MSDNNPSPKPATLEELQRRIEKLEAGQDEQMQRIIYLTERYEKLKRIFLRLGGIIKAENVVE